MQKSAEHRQTLLADQGMGPAPARASTDAFWPARVSSACMPQQLCHHAGWETCTSPRVPQGKHRQRAASSAVSVLMACLAYCLLCLCQSTCC